MAARIAFATFGLCIALFPASASAGRLVATGHDADHHCGREIEDIKHEQCRFFQVAVDYSRAGAPDPSKPVLVLDRGELDVITSIDRVYGAAMPRVVIDPRSDAFRSEQITVSRYSAVIIASSGGDPADPTQQDLNELRSTPDSDAINARAAALRAFFDAGGGIYVNSGSKHGDDVGDPYYDFLPVTVRGAGVTSPFLLTDAGRGLGFAERDITCCPTHNTFEPPAQNSPLRAIDTDSDGRIVSLFGETERFSALADPPLTQGARNVIAAGIPASDASPTSSSTVRCGTQRTVTLHLRRPKGVRFSRVNIYVQGKLIKRYRGARVTKPIKIKLPNTRSGRASVRLVIYTTGTRRLTIRRTYKTCVSG